MTLLFQMKTFVMFLWILYLFTQVNRGEWRGIECLERANVFEVKSSRLVKCQKELHQPKNPKQNLQIVLCHPKCCHLQLRTTKTSCYRQPLKLHVPCSLNTATPNNFLMVSKSIMVKIRQRTMTIIVCSYSVSEFTRNKWLKKSSLVCFAWSTLLHLSCWWAEVIH